LCVRGAEKQPPQKPDQEVLERGVAHLLVLLLPVEGLREAPAGVHPRSSAQTFDGLLGVPTLLERSVRRQRGLDALEEYHIVLARLGRAAEWQWPLDHAGGADCPLRR